MPLFLSHEQYLKTVLNFSDVSTGTVNFTGMLKEVSMWQTVLYGQNFTGPLDVHDNFYIVVLLNTNCKKSSLTAIKPA